MLDELHNKQVKLIKSSQGIQFKIHSLSFKICYYIYAISMKYNHNTSIGYRKFTDILSTYVHWNS